MTAMRQTIRTPQQLTVSTIPTGWLRPCILSGAVVVTFLFSLTDRIRFIGSDTPLAYLALVPVIALGIGMWRYRAAGPERSRLTPLDIAVSGTLLIAAMGIAVIGPTLLNAYAAWARPDLLALPLYATGLFCLFYGVAGLTWGWPALVFLALIWPVPFQVALPPLLDALTQWTAAMTRLLVAILPLGTHPVTPGSALFSINTPQGEGVLGIGSACAGLEAISTVGLLGSGTLLITRSSAAKWQWRFAYRFAWLVTGILLASVGNLLRIALVFAAGHIFGLSFAMAVVHPYAGMAVLGIVMAAMIVLLPRFTLHLLRPTAAKPLPWRDIRWGLGIAMSFALVLAGLVWSGMPLFAALGDRVIGTQLDLVNGPLRVGMIGSLGLLAVFLILGTPSEDPRSVLAPATRMRQRRRQGQIITSATYGIIIGTSILLAVADTTVAPTFAAPPMVNGAILQDYEAALPPIAGTAPVYDFTVSWLQPYFGDESTRLIYNYGTSHENAELFAIVDTAHSARSMSAYTLWDCYQWHGFRDLRQTSVPIGHGVSATVITWYDRVSQHAWISYSWTQPIERAGETQHQRIALTTSFLAEDTDATQRTLITDRNTEMRTQASEVLDHLWRPAA